MPSTAEPTARANKNGSTSPSIATPAQTFPSVSTRTSCFPALQAMRVGDFSVRISGDWIGIEGKIADTFNEIAAANQRMAQQLERVGQRVGKEGKTKQRVRSGFQAAHGARWNRRSTP
jgi:hypothetical protein